MFPPQVLASTFPFKKLGTTLFAFQEITSTNSFALELIQKNPVPGTLILADHQTAGRGRMNRHWFSPPGANIYGSLIIQSSLPVKHSGWIPLLSGLAIGRAIEESAGIPVLLKWPNDLLIHEKKLGGILCETANGVDGRRWTVIGFGINVNMTENDFPYEIKMKMISLQQAVGHLLDRLTLLQHISTSLEKVWTDLDSNLFPRWKTAYGNRCATLGRWVQVQFPDGSVLTGLANAIGDEGQLQVLPASSTGNRHSDTMIAIHSADILHVRPADSPQI